MPAISTFLKICTFVAVLRTDTLAAVTPYYTQGTDPFWIVSHPPLISTRVDPILSPGSVAGHTHQILGTSSFQPTYDYTNNLAGKCTTANIVNDKSSYWIPQLYRKTGAKFALVPLSYANTYYQMRRTGEEPVYEFPPGFRMLAGDATRSTYNSSDPTNTAISYTCLYTGQPETSGFPPYNCPGGLRAQVYFPHCWDGVNNWLEGSAHVAYGAGNYNGGGACPSTHPKRIMGVFYEFIYKDDYAYQAGARVWATGDDVGYSLHGDFATGWPLGFFQEIFDYGSACSVGFDLAACPPLAQHYTNNNATPSACNPEGVIVDEDVGWNGDLTKLPGDNPVWGGSIPKATVPNYQNIELFIQAAPVLPSDWRKVGCIAEPQGKRALQAASTTSPEMTPDSCMSFCAGKGYSLAGIEYADECYCGNSLSGTSLTAVMDDSYCGMDCAGAMYGKTFCGGPSNLTVYQYSGSGSPTVDVATATPVAPTGKGEPSVIPVPAAADILADQVYGGSSWSNPYASVSTPTYQGGSVASPTGSLGSTTNFTTGMTATTSPTSSVSFVRSASRSVSPSSGISGPSGQNKVVSSSIASGVSPSSSVLGNEAIAQTGSIAASISASASPATSATLSSSDSASTAGSASSTGSGSDKTCSRSKKRSKTH